MSKSLKRTEEINNTLKLILKKISDGGATKKWSQDVCVSQILNVRYVTHNRNITCVLKTKKGYPKKTCQNL